MRRVAVVGSGIAGLSVAHGLAGQAQVTLYEGADYFGGHTHTVDVALDGMTHPVDTGFLVLNERTYPNLLRLFERLGVATAASEMSFSVQVPDVGLEWSGCNLNTVFAQRTNLARPRFWRMLADVLRFNRLATALARDGGAQALDLGIGEFLRLHRFGAEFRDWYFLPMIGCIWSCPVQQMLRFPIATLIRFCHNHGLLQISHRPQWYTVAGGARTYVHKMLASVPDARLNARVLQVQRPHPGEPDRRVRVTTEAGCEHFDAVVLACHSDQALALLADPSSAEQRVLGAIRYHANRAVLHTDTGVLPRRRAAWAAWNYERAAGVGHEPAGVCLHYLLNRLQPLPFATPVVVSLNPVREPDPERVHATFEYAHPVFDRDAILAQQQVPALQGQRQTWFCGAWTRYGFHEDGLTSGWDVCAALRRTWDGAPAADALEAA
jgi:predicted NAD/FAD-binding protein